MRAINTDEHEIDDEVSESYEVIPEGVWRNKRGNKYIKLHNKLYETLLTVNIQSLDSKEETIKIDNIDRMLYEVAKIEVPDVTRNLL